MDKVKKEKVFVVSCIVVLFILFFPNDPIYLGRGFRYLDNLHIIEYWRNKDSTSVIIPATVTAYINSHGYILAQQQPRKFNEDFFSTHYQYPLGRDTTYYWLVNKETKEQAGPLLYSEMELLLQEKGLERMLQNIEKGRIYLTKDEAKKNE